MSCRVHGRQHLDAEYISQDPPEHYDTEHSPDDRGTSQPLVQAWHTAAHEPCEDKKSKEWNRDDHQGIAFKCRGHIKVQESMDGPLRAASGTVQPGKLMEDAPGEEYRLRRIELHVYEYGGKGHRQYRDDHKP